MGNSRGTMDCNSGELGILIPELFFWVAYIHDQAAAEEFVVGKAGCGHCPVLAIDMLLCRAAVRKMRQNLAEREICLFYFRRSNQALIHLRIDPVVTVHVADPVTGGEVKADVARSPLSAVFNGTELETGRICITVFLQDAFRSIRRAVIYNDQLINRSGLVKDRIQTLPYGFLRIVCGYDHTKLHPHAPP